MVGVVMGDDQPLHRFAAQGHGEQRLPDRLGMFGGYAGIDQGPAIAIVQRVAIHMVQRHRQRQAQPADAGGNLDRLEFGGGQRERILQGVGHAGTALALVTGAVAGA